MDPNEIQIKNKHTSCLLVFSASVIGLLVLGVVVVFFVIYNQYGTHARYPDMPGDMRLLELPFYDLLCDAYNIHSSIQSTENTRRGVSNSEPWFDLYVLDWDPVLHLMQNRTSTTMSGISHISSYRYEAFVFHLIQDSVINMKLDVTQCARCGTYFSVYILRGKENFQRWSSDARCDRNADCIPENGCVYLANISNIHSNNSKIEGSFGSFITPVTDDYKVVLYGLGASTPSCQGSKFVTMEFVVDRYLYVIPPSAIIRASQQADYSFSNRSQVFVLSFPGRYSSLNTTNKSLETIHVFVKCKRSPVGFLLVFGVPVLLLTGVLVLVVRCACTHKPVIDEEQARLLQRAEREGSEYERSYD